ncbi:hypothetical protein ACH5RR_007099 [Cinchona calisaya]|uniref:Uncharacterized protein n=1 Tax=Cinchona calisaya TaxID=153742 RepID=A0ABD3AQY1_9GENT
MQTKKKHDKDQTLVIQNAARKDDETIGNKEQANQKSVTAGGSVGQKLGKTVQIWQPKDTSHPIADSQDKGYEISASSQPNTLNQSNSFTVGIPENSPSAVPVIGPVSNPIQENEEKQADVDNNDNNNNDITDDDEEQNNQNNQDNEEDGAAGDAANGDNYGKPVEEIPNSNDLMLTISDDQAQVSDALQETCDQQEKTTCSDLDVADGVDIDVLIADSME